MEEQDQNTSQPQEQQIYKPRPTWQVWGARILLVVFVAFLLMYYVNLLRGGH